MRILKVVKATDKGGVFTCEKQIIQELKKRNATVDVVILGNGGNQKEYEKMCDKAYYLPPLDASYGGSFKTILYSIYKTHRYGVKYAASLKKQIGDNVRYDAIMYQRPIFIHLVGMLSGLLQSKGLWHLPNVARTSFSRNYYNYFCKKYNIISLANSYFTKASLGKQCKHVVYPGYDSKRIEKKAPMLRYALMIAEGAPVYGIAARMHKDKAQDLVVKAFANSNVPAAGGHLLIAGGPLDSNFAQEVQRQAGSLLHKQIHFLGDVKDMPAFYSSVDVVINGRRNVEPFGISVAEAMGAGKPVIAYNLGGPAEMIDHNVSGWLVENPTAEDYKEIFNLSIANKARWAEMGACAKENSYKFTVEENVNTLLNIIKGSEKEAYTETRLKTV